MTSLAWLIDLGPSTIVLQAAQALLTAAVFGLFQRRYASPALAPWTLAWLADFLHLAGLGVMEAEAARFPATGGPMTALAAATLLAGYLNVGWLLLGAFAFAHGRRADTRVERGTVALAVAITAVTMLPAVADPDGQLARYVARAGVFGVLGGSARVAAGVALLRRGWWREAPDTSRHAWGEDRLELGRLLVAGSLLALGFLTLASFALTLAFALTYPSPGSAEFVPTVPNAGGLHHLIIVELAIGLVIWLLEGEQRRAEHRAYHDPLTGLPNRQLLVDRLHHQVAVARRTREPFGVLFIDVDHFKAINDAHGHATGDRVLQAIAARLTGALREVDTVARLGGDEFVVLATGVRAPHDVGGIAAKLRDATQPPIVVEGRQVLATLSIGAALYPADATDAGALLRASDAALYRAKQEGRDRVLLAGT